MQLEIFSSRSEACKYVVEEHHIMTEVNRSRALNGPMIEYKYPPPVFKIIVFFLLIFAVRSLPTRSTPHIYLLIVSAVTVTSVTEAINTIYDPSVPPLHLATNVTQISTPQQ